MPASPSREALRTAVLGEIEKRKKRKDQAEHLKGDFAAFIRASWSIVEPAMPLIDNWHIDALAEHLQAVGEGKIRFLMINIGPGYAKSIIASVMFSAWLWARRPQTRILAATYASALTIRDSIRTRDLITSPWFQGNFNPQWGVSRQQKEVDYERRNGQTGAWEMVKENEDWLSNTLSGDRRALSVGGKATGFRADGQIFDDLLNASDKHSKPARDTATDWAIRTMSTRFNDMRIGWRVVIGQRLHEEDPYGAMIATGDYDLLCLPSEFEPERRAKTSIGWTDPRTEAGELLFPELFTAEVLAKAKRDLGSYDYAGQHQQSPAPVDGELLKRDWWRYYDPAQMMVFDAMCISVDATFKAVSDSDYVSIQVWGFIGPRSYLVDRIHERMGYVATKQAIKGLIAKYPKAWAKLIEDKANGSAIIEELKREFYGVIAINPEGGKESRAAAVSPTVEAGNVYLPDLPWAQEVVDEAAVFPNGAHDDDVDSMTQALMWRLKHNLKFGFTQYLKGEDEEMKRKYAQRVKKTQELGNAVVDVPSMEQLAKVEHVDGVAKPDVDDGAERCPVETCRSTLIVRRGGGKRCNQCGHQFGMSGLGVSEGQLRK
jgi:predicted phage terminase large subunit-like protein